jgi:ABC transport system ATP-binding/permease protein
VLETPLSSIGGGSNTGGARRFPPSFWQERFESVDLMQALKVGGGMASQLVSAGDVAEHLPVPPKPTRRLRAVLAVFATHFLRSFLSKVRSRGMVYSTCLEAPLLAALIAITLRSSPTGTYVFSTALHLPAYLFLSATVAMFLGLTNSATEVLRDRPILRRERNCQPGAGSYVVAKFCALGLVASIQCLAYLIVGNYYLDIVGMLPSLWLWMTLTALTGTALALVISSLVSSERAALTAVPLLLVPQMLLAGALVSYREMNHGLFSNVQATRDRGGIPVPAVIMPLRYAYEGMIVAQATRNPFEAERISLQERIDKMRSFKEPMNRQQSERFDLIKEGLRSLLASGAKSQEEALEMIQRIQRISMSGTRLEVETLKVWPDGGKEVRPTSEFFVNDRIDLMVREGETFRNDYRNTEPRIVFHALKKPIPLLAKKRDPNAKLEYLERDDEIGTERYCGIILGGLIVACIAVSTLIISRQNRQVK